MKQLPGWMAAGLLLAGTVAGAGAADDAAEVAALSDALDRAIVAGDRERAAGLYCDDFLLTTSAGNTKRRADMLKDVQLPGLAWDINRTSEVQVRVHGDVAVLTGTLRQKGRLGEQSFDHRFRVTDTWTRSCGEGWRLLAGHATRLAEPAQP